MRINLRGADVPAPQLLLHRADIHTTFQQVSGKATAQGMTTVRFGDARLADRQLDGPLQSAFVQVVSRVTPQRGVGAIEV